MEHPLRGNPERELPCLCPAEFSRWAQGEDRRQPKKHRSPTEHPLITQGQQTMSEDRSHVNQECQSEREKARDEADASQLRLHCAGTSQDREDVGRNLIFS